VRILALLPIVTKAQAHRLRDGQRFPFVQPRNRQLT
jgi:hypothetical protein